ncbi:MAG: hypothetical protein ACRDTC_15420 [Pseudonocardiaceae bacterium]
MSPKRGDRTAPPRVGKEYEIRFDNAESAKGWEELARTASANLRRAFEAIREDSRPVPSIERHHRLRGSLSTANRRGDDLEQWQFEVIGDGRIWYLIDDTTRTAWITYAGTGLGSNDRRGGDTGHRPTPTDLVYHGVH